MSELVSTMMHPRGTNSVKKFGTHHGKKSQSNHVHSMQTLINSQQTQLNTASAFVRDISSRKSNLPQLRAQTQLYGTPSSQIKFVITTEQQYCGLTAMLNRLQKKILRPGPESRNHPDSGIKD